MLATFCIEEFIKVQILLEIAGIDFKGNKTVIKRSVKTI